VCARLAWSNLSPAKLEWTGDPLLHFAARVRPTAPFRPPHFTLRMRDNNKGIPYKINIRLFCRIFVISAAADAVSRKRSQVSQRTAVDPSFLSVSPMRAGFPNAHSVRIAQFNSVAPKLNCFLPAGIDPAPALRRYFKVTSDDSHKPKCSITLSSSSSSSTRFF